ncbi:hypothetical protein ACFYM2_11955 [Streptomyces sp. NPDC006711]|uniref:hypothetical protein n=1 Tax=unclassified Streptomyces TaxID=2593676 RepID=UPI0033FEE50C
MKNGAFRPGVLLLAVAGMLVVGLPLAGAEPGPPPGPAPAQGPASRDTASGPHGVLPDKECRPASLPHQEPAPGERARAATAVRACWSVSGPAVRPGAGGVELRARTLTVTGLYCPPVAGTCRAATINLRRPRILYGATTGAASCVVAERLTLTGSVEFSASMVRGRAFGVLPLAISTRLVPPVPLPLLVLDDVVANGLSVRADRVEGTAMTIGPARVCSDAR